MNTEQSTLPLSAERQAEITEQAQPRLVNGQWEGVPISRFPDLQAIVKKALEDGTLVIS